MKVQFTYVYIASRVIYLLEEWHRNWHSRQCSSTPKKAKFKDWFRGTSSSDIGQQ